MSAGSAVASNLAMIIEAKTIGLVKFFKEKKALSPESAIEITDNIVIDFGPDKISLSKKEVDQYSNTFLVNIENTNKYYFDQKKYDEFDNKRKNFVKKFLIGFFLVFALFLIVVFYLFA